MSKRKSRVLKMTRKQSKRVVPGPMRHDGLPPHLLAMCKYTFPRVGKHVVPTLEQWELGFMRDAHPERELCMWLRMCIVLDKLQPDDPVPVIGQLVSLSSGLPAHGEVAELWHGIDRSDLERAIVEIEELETE